MVILVEPFCLLNEPEKIIDAQKNEAIVCQEYEKIR
jgi:hypothetical protein